MRRLRCTEESDLKASLRNLRAKSSSLSSFWSTLSIGSADEGLCSGVHPVVWAPVWAGGTAGWLQHGPAGRVRCSAAWFRMGR